MASSSRSAWLVTQEWAIVGVVFAVAAAAFWGQLATSVNLALTDISDTVTP